MVVANCHETLHSDNQPKYTEAQCQGCHPDCGRGHIEPAPVNIYYRP